MLTKKVLCGALRSAYHTKHDSTHEVGWRVQNKPWTRKDVSQRLRAAYRARSITYNCEECTRPQPLQNYTLHPLINTLLELHLVRDMVLSNIYRLFQKREVLRAVCYSMGFLLMRSRIILLNLK